MLKGHTGAKEFHRMALLRYDSPSDEFECSASLISNSYVLTAAHCVRIPDTNPIMYFSKLNFFSACNLLVRNISKGQLERAFSRTIKKKYKKKFKICESFRRLRLVQICKLFNVAAI
uniref:Peptidase S1 domain-containing protein n=1 Tax=Glossina brevipalpis TaxID=37001 RepID=A0A1A9WYD1_9MUSC